jgi:hypothetical protein
MSYRLLNTGRPHRCKSCLTYLICSRSYTAILAVCCHCIVLTARAYTCESDSSCDYVSCNKGCYTNISGSNICYNYGCTFGKCWWCEPLNGSSSCFFSFSPEFSKSYWCPDPPACDVGTWSRTGYRPCSSCISSCLSGHYLEDCGGSSAGNCSICPNGSYSISSGFSACSACSASSCAAGHYLSGCGGSSAGTCMKCQSRTYNIASGMPTCTACSSGILIVLEFLFVFHSATESRQAHICWKCCSNN